MQGEEQLGSEGGCSSAQTGFSKQCLSLLCTVLDFLSLTGDNNYLKFLMVSVMG